MQVINKLDKSYNYTNNINNIIKIFEHLRNRNVNIIDLGIWQYFNNFNIDLLNLLNIENHLYEIYPITQMLFIIKKIKHFLYHL